MKAYYFFYSFVTFFSFWITKEMEKPGCVEYNISNLKEDFNIDDIILRLVLLECSALSLCTLYCQTKLYHR